MKVLAFFLIALVVSTSVYVIASRGPDLGGALRSTVVVVCDGSYGTGWWLNDDGAIVTANHVVDECNDIKVVRGDYVARATVIAANETLDIALLRAVEKPPWEPQTLKLARSIAVGDTIYVVGYPKQLFAELDGDIAEMSIAPRVSEGKIAWLNPEKSVAEITAKTDKGNSGGPVVNEDGDLVGIIVYARPGAVDNPVYMLTVNGVAGFLDAVDAQYQTSFAGRGLRLLAAGGLIPAAALIALRLGGGRR